MSAFELFLSGAETPSWRKMLTEAGSPMAFSYKGIVRRGLPKTKDYLLAEKFDSDLPLLLDSGAHSFNNALGATPRGELLAFAEAYEQFVVANLGRVTFVAEFDALDLGRDWLLSRRKEFYDQLPPEKFMAVWHEEYGLEALTADARRYEVLGVTTTKLDSGVNLQSMLHGVARGGTHLHGMSITSDVLHTIPFSSASSTSWTSPMRFGDFIIWDGRKLHRYPRAYRDQARQQHRRTIEAAGFDAEAVIAGDQGEVARLTIWSWQQLAADLSGRRKPPRPRNDPFSTSDAPITVENGVSPEGSKAETVEGATVIGDLVVRKSSTVGSRLTRSDLKVLPTMRVERIEREETLPDGSKLDNSIELTRTSSGSARVCDNCYLSEKCPEYESGNDCVFHIPVAVTTREQRQALASGMIEMQAQRVMLGKFSEDLSGGMPDPNLSSEMDRLFKLMVMQKEIEDDRESFEMTIKQKGKSMQLDRIFGADSPPRHPQVSADAPSVDPMHVIEGKLVNR